MARTALSQSGFVTVRSEGGLLPPDLLARIAGNDPELGGLAPEDYGLAKSERLHEAASRAWEHAKAYWAAFRAATEELQPGESGVTETRELWLLPLFRELGYGRLVFRQAAEEAGGRRYAISHQAGKGPGAPPVHTVSFRQEIDRAPGARELAPGQLRMSPHGLVQEYLNRTGHLWGIVTNGRRLRLLRDNQSLSRAAFVEFDLEAMLDGGVYADFVLLYLLLHRSRLPAPGGRPEDCWLERWRLTAESQGTRALDELRAGVEAAIRALGHGLIEHPANGHLREALTSGRLSVQDYYRQLLRLVYRLLFLFAAEERDLLFPPDADPRTVEIYRRHYGAGRLRELAARRRHRDRHDDLWRSLRVTFAALRDEKVGAPLGLRPLAGGLFGPDSCPHIDAALIGNTRLLEAIEGLSFVKSNGVYRRVNYRDMDIEELGSVYESLLELQPVLRTAGERPVFELGASGERKSTGSYYTNPDLVRELIASALDPVIEEALSRGRTVEEKRDNLLDLKVCDPACGSGHFLLAAARRIGQEVARLDAGETEPDPALVRHATREAIRHCVYGVDLNPLAVDLCKLALWLEAHEPGKPIPFLDHHIRHGNSLVGATAAAVAEGIPDAAFEPVTGDDTKYARDVKKRNAGQRKNLSFDDTGWIVTPLADAEAVRRYFAAMEAPDETVEDEVHKAETHERYRRSRDFLRRQTVADLWTAAFFWPLRPGEPEPPAQGIFRRLAADPNLTDFIDARKRSEVEGRAEFRTVRLARRLAKQFAFFHWELEFPEVFGPPDPGFDCVLGNPPWEQIQPEEQKFFAVPAPEIAAAAGARRKALIQALPKTNPDLAAAWAAHVRSIESLSKFTRASGRFPLTSFGKINTYSTFAELMATLIRQRGRAGVIVPTGIATDDTNKHFFGWLVGHGRLASLFDFENREGVFPSVHRSYKFSLLTMAGSGRATRAFDAAFFLLQPAELREDGRRFTLTAEEIALLNPNTRTCPIFRTARDAEITKRIYRAAPVLVREGPPEVNPWGVTLRQGLFNMTSDSHLFRTRRALEDAGYALGTDGRFRGHGECWLPLYEAKMIHQFDHRFATYEGGPAEDRTRDVTPAEHADPSFVPLPRYWVEEREVEREVGSIRHHRGWLLGWRDIARNTDERTFIFSLFPLSGAGDTLLIMKPAHEENQTICGLLANLNAVVFDYATRQKVGGTHLKFFTVKQLPVLPPETYTPALLEEIVPRVLELVYTAHDLAPFSRDCGYDGPPFIWDEERRAQLRAELDGIYAHLYGLSRDDFAYILDTFPIVRRKDEERYGEYRTKRLCLEAYDRFEGIAEVAGGGSRPASQAEPVARGGQWRGEWRGG